MLVMRPEAAQRVTVFGSTRNSAATSPGVRRRSLLPSTFSLLRLSPPSLPQSPRTVLLEPWVRCPSSLALNEYFLPRFLEISRRFAAGQAMYGSSSITLSNKHPGSQAFLPELSAQLDPGTGRGVTR